VAPLAELAKLRCTSEIVKQKATVRREFIKSTQEKSGSE
jgi:hypothetical protein